MISKLPKHQQRVKMWTTAQNTWNTIFFIFVLTNTWLFKEFALFKRSKQHFKYLTIPRNVEDFEKLPKYTKAINPFHYQYKDIVLICFRRLPDATNIAYFVVFITIAFVILMLAICLLMIQHRKGMEYGFYHIFIWMVEL